MTNQLNLLFVCTGNIARSALADRYLVHLLAGHESPFTVSSAGLGRVEGLPVPDEIEALAARQGASMNGFVSRQFTAAIGRSADLILTATRGHRSGVLDELPGHLKRCFTIVEFSSALADREPIGSRPEDWVAAISQIAGNRPSLADGDIPDPYRQSAEVYEEMAALLLPAVESIARQVIGR